MFEIPSDANPLFQFGVIIAFVIAMVAFICWLSSTDGGRDD